MALLLLVLALVLVLAVMVLLLSGPLPVILRAALASAFHAACSASS
jgi:hypothetical protein